MRIGWHLGNDTGVRPSDWAIMERVRPQMIVFLPGYRLNPQSISKADIRRILALSPGCHVFLRPYVAPYQLESREGFLAYLDAMREVVLSWADVVPDGQRHWQLFNEQNMPRHAGGWEGFGDTEPDMRRFNAWFTEGYQTLKRCDGRALFGFSPLTIGNRDAWFAGDPQGPYYMHGVAGCQPTLSAAAQFFAMASGPCYDAIRLSDEYYAHVYTHAQAGMTAEEIAVHPAYGQRHERYRLFLPEDKPIWITECGAPNKFHQEQAGLGLGILTWLRSLKDVAGAALWILGNNPQWGGEMWAGKWSLLDQIAALQAETVDVEQAIGEAVQGAIIPLNPEAALEKAGMARGLIAVSREGRTTVGGTVYAWQAFRGADRSKQHIAYCIEGDWNVIKWFERAN